MFHLNYYYFNKAVNDCKDLLSRNKYYTLDDLNQAEKIAIELSTAIINGKKLNKPLLKRGNHKLEKNIIIWDLPSGITCACNCTGCYAVKSERYRGAVRIMRLYHLIMLKYAEYNEDFKISLLQYMGNELEKHYEYCTKKKIIPICRIHSSGDIYNGWYKIFLLDLATNNPKIKFYTYTKQLGNDTINIINSNYSNFNMVKSLIDINGKKFINYGDMQYINKIASALKQDNQPCKICSYGIDPSITCGYNCTACLNCPNVLFKKH